MTPGGQEAQDPLHWLAATRAGGQPCGWRGGGYVGAVFIDDEWPPGVKADALSLVFGSGMAEAVVANGFESAGQHMAQVTPNKLPPFNRLGFLHVAVGTILPGEGDVGVGERLDARVGNGGAADVGAQILDGVEAVAKGLELDAPVLLPEARIDRGQLGVGVESLKSLAEALAKSPSQDRLGGQETGALDLDGLVV